MSSVSMAQALDTRAGAALYGASVGVLVALLALWFNNGPLATTPALLFVGIAEALSALVSCEAAVCGDGYNFASLCAAVLPGV